MIRQFIQVPIIVDALQLPLDTESLITVQNWLNVDHLVMTADGLQIPSADKTEYQLAVKGDWIIRDTEDGLVTVVDGELFDKAFKPVNLNDT